LVAAGLTVFGLCGVGVVLLATRSGVGLGGDSYYYVSGARNLVAGLGFSRPAADGGIRIITHYPPGYSALLAALIELGADALCAARALAAGLFGVNIGLFGLMVYRANRWPPAALVAAFLALTLPAWIVNHTWALSEPLFITFTLLTFLLLVAAVERGRAREVGAAGLAATLAFLTRYAGIALLVCGAVVLLAAGPASIGRRSARAAAFVAVSAVGPIAWAIRNLAATGSLTNRAFDVHLPGGERVLEAAQTITLWLLPARVPSLVRAGLTAVVAIAALTLVVRLLSRPRGAGERARAVILGWVLAVFALVYPLFLAASLTFVDASTPLDDRILSPLLVSLLALAVLAFGEVWRNGRGPRWLRAVIGVAVAGFLALTLYRGYGAVLRLREDGQGYAARAWRESELMHWVRQLPGEVSIYSNELDAVYLQTGRQAFQVPIRWDPVREAPRDDYPEQLAAMRRRVQEEGAVLVLFATISGQQAFLPTEAELTDGLAEVFRSSDGAAYAGPPMELQGLIEARGRRLW
jgi:4-amino-4-deoxy-L-arabinose transferase-like glycosyltransferase